MKRFGCSQAFVVSTALAAIYGIKIERFYDADRRKQRRKRAKVLKFKRVS